MKVIIREPSPSEADQIAEIHVLSSAGAYGSDSTTSITTDERKEHWRSWLNDEDHGTQVADIDGNIKGFCTVKPSRDEDTDPDTVDEMLMIYLLPEMWRKGIGNSLCKKALSVAKAEGKKEMIIWVLEDNGGARRFYEAMGFIVDTRVAPRRKAIRYAIDLRV